MKTNPASVLSFLVFALLLLTTGCKKETADPWEDDDPDDQDNPISYSFSDPVNVRINAQHVGIASKSLLSKTEIAGNYIYFSSGTGYDNFPSDIFKSPIGVSNSISTGFEINPNAYEFNYSNNAVNKYTLRPAVSLFTIDKSGEYLYRFNTNTGQLHDLAKHGVSFQVYKGNLSTGASTELVSSGALTQLNFLANADLKGMRVDDAGNVYIASMAKDGCIVKVSASGQVTQLATNLINPGFFTIHNGFLYVPIGLATDGKIVKIDRDNGNITNVITNLTGPTNVVVDNHGNLVVRSLHTSNGGNYHRYDIYKPNGEFIDYITDASGYSILSDTYENMPMYVDSNNNLYFYHADGVVSGGYTSNNPKGQKGIFKIGLIKN